MKRKNEQWKLYKVTFAVLVVLLGLLSSIAYTNAKAESNYKEVLDDVTEAVKSVREITSEISKQGVISEVEPAVIGDVEDNNETEEVLEEPLEEYSEEVYSIDEYSDEIYEEPLEEYYEEEYVEEAQEEEIYETYTTTYSPEYLRTMGVVYDGGFRYTWYSERVLPGGGLNIPGRWSDGNFVRDENGYICVASEDFEKGTVLDTPWGASKVYDCGCAHGTIDMYVSW